MRWVYYAVALLATVLAGLLWLFVFGQFRPAGSVPALPLAPASVVLLVPSGQLPVPPRLRPAGASCARGRFVRERRTEEGYAYDVEVRIDGKVVPCR